MRAVFGNLIDSDQPGWIFIGQRLEQGGITTKTKIATLAQIPRASMKMAVQLKMRFFA